MIQNSDRTIDGTLAVDIIAVKNKITVTHRMHSRDGFRCCYNAQTAVDGGSHLIAGYNVTGQNTDQGLLNETVSMAKEALDTEVN